MGWAGGRISIAAALVVVLALGSQSAAARETVVSSVRSERHGRSVELHLKLTGMPRLLTTGNGNELRIDLDNTRLEIPPRAVFGEDSAPLSGLRAIQDPDGRSRLIVEVSEKSDYAIAQIPGEIVIRLAPAGQVPDLAAPSPQLRNHHRVAGLQTDVLLRILPFDHFFVIEWDLLLRSVRGLAKNINRFLLCKVFETAGHRNGIEHRGRTRQQISAGSSHHTQDVHLLTLAIGNDDGNFGLGDKVLQALSNFLLKL